MDILSLWDVPSRKGLEENKTSEMEKDVYGSTQEIESGTNMVFSNLC